MGEPFERVVNRIERSQLFSVSGKPSGRGWGKNCSNRRMKSGSVESKIPAFRVVNSSALNTDF